MKSVFSRKQSGTVFLLYLLVIFAGSSYFLLQRLNKDLYKPDISKTYQVLQEAKQALISYAVVNAETDIKRAGKYGFLPCPSRAKFSEEGNQIASCNDKYVNTIGRFPWQTLGVEPLRDSSGECLWYAVSGAFKNAPNKMLNADTTGSFRVVDRQDRIITGNTAASRAVAVIIAPGRAIQDQTRTTVAKTSVCGGKYDDDNDILNYLDGKNAGVSDKADAIDDFMTTDNLSDDVFNDVLVYITAKEVFDAVNQRSDIAKKLYDPKATHNLTRMIAECIAGFAKVNKSDNKYVMPWPAPLTLSDYRNDNDYNDHNHTSQTDNRNLFGRVPIIIDSSLIALSTDTSDSNFINYCKNRVWPALFHSDDEMNKEKKLTELETLWKNWKDHLFYATTEPHQPIKTTFDNCGSGARCITINYDYADSGGDNDFAGVVIFAGDPLATQSRLTKPLDGVEQNSQIAQYLENKQGRTNNIMMYTDGQGDSTHRYDYKESDDSFNDIYYCINDGDDNNGKDFEVCHCPNNVITNGSTFLNSENCSI